MDADSGIQALLDRAAELDGNPAGLLALLRAIEAAHRAIQDGPFRSSLPEDRNRLFDLLADMERSGGWPYIPRLQLRTFLDLLQGEPDDVAPDDDPNGGHGVHPSSPGQSDDNADGPLAA